MGAQPERRGARVCAAKPVRAGETVADIITARRGVFTAPREAGLVGVQSQRRNSGIELTTWLIPFS